MTSNVESGAQVTACNSHRSSLSKGDRILVLVLLIVELIMFGFWFQSSFFKYESSWSNPDKGECGRKLSANGRFLYQTCTVETTEAILPKQVDGKNSYDEIIVGSDPGGAHTIFQLGELPISFAYPAGGLSFNSSSAIRSKDSLNKKEIVYQWSEWNVSYLFLMAFFLIITGLELACRRITRRFRARSV